MTINEIQDDIIEEFIIFDDWMDRYGYLIDLGNEMSEMEANRKSEQTLIEGCQSKVWIDAEMDGETIKFFAESDAVIVKGIVALLLRVFSGQPVKDVATADLYFIERIGLSNHLSPTRSNGLVSMVKQMKLYAIAYTAKLKL